MKFLSKDGKIFKDKTSGKFIGYNPPLNDYSWAEIRAISDAGTGANYWQVGDTKTIVINGTVGKTTFNNLSIDCFILGFNHNAAKEGNNRIHFCIGKSGDKLVGLVDEKYNSKISETGYFSVNSTETNVGGWKDCQLKNTVLQGTGTPNNPTVNTILAALPTDLLAVLKSITKYTDNVGNQTGSIKANVTATLDYIFILATFEVITNDSYSTTNTYEAAYQQQYDYFKNGNSNIAYKYNDTSTGAVWWLRSPNRSAAITFCTVNLGGRVNGRGADNVVAILPCFCV